jgi:polar amino acid transport system substrate-binding protein
MRHFRHTKKKDGSMKKAAFLIILLLFCPMSQGATAGGEPGEIVLASEEWANATNKDGTGLYWDIFRAVYEPVGIKTKFIIRSYKGSVSLVKKNQADAAVGIHPDKIQGALSSRYPFVKDYLLVLFKKNRFDQWNGQETLKNRKIGWIKGYSYDDYLEVSVTKREFLRRKSILQQLDRDQIDFFMDTRNDVESVLNKGIIDVTRYTVETVLELERYLVFADNKKGKELKKIFDNRFPYLVQSGEIEKLFAKWNW